MKLKELLTRLDNLIEGFGDNDVLINGGRVTRIVTEEIVPPSYDTSFIGESFEIDAKRTVTVWGEINKKEDEPVPVFNTKKIYVPDDVMALDTETGIIFSNNDKYEVSDGIIGIGPVGNVCQGGKWDFPFCGSYLPAQQQIELANLMITRWYEYKNEAIRSMNEDTTKTS